VEREQHVIAELLVVSDVSQKLRYALEVCTVIAIIMLLLALSARSFETHLVRSQIAEAFMLSSTVREEMIAFRAGTGRWPSSEPELQNATLSERSGVGSVVDHLELLDGGVISAVFDEQRSAAHLQGRRLSFRPSTVDGDGSAPITWLCAAHRVPEGRIVSGRDDTDIAPALLPSACRSH